MRRNPLAEEMAERLALAAAAAVEMRRFGHPATHVGALLAIFRDLAGRLAGREGEILPTDERDRLIDNGMVAAQTGSEARGEIELLLGERCYRLLLPVEGGVRLSGREDLAGSALLSAREMLARAAAGDTALRQALAHQHVVAFPETAWLMRAFAGPGAPKNAIEKRYGDHFIVCRKINAVVADYVAKELEELGIVRRADREGLRLVWAPAPAVAMYIVDRYLEVTGHMLDVQVPTADLRDQLGFILPARLFDGPWRQQIEVPSDGLHAEAGGVRQRLTPEGFLWFVERGLVDPLAVAHVLALAGAVNALAQLRARLMPILEGFSGVANRANVIAALQP